MCGRFACTLQKHEIVQRCQCALPSVASGKKEVQWVNVNTSSGEYSPRYNLSPGNLSPVLVSMNHLPSSSPSKAAYAVCPMRWGLIPSWFQGTSPGEYGYKTINCRADGIQSKPTYCTPLKRGQRCVVLANGFFEWKKEKGGKKQPYLVYYPSSSQGKAMKYEEEELIDGWQSPHLLNMAGLFDTWNQDGDLLYTYTVITVDASPNLAWLHDRMPAVLDGADEVEMWLDSKSTSTDEAVSLLKPVDNLHWHAVSSCVSNSRNDSIECVLPLKKEQKRPAETLLTKWLKRPESNSASSTSHGTDKQPAKKIKYL